MRIIVLDYAADGGGALSILNDFYSYVRDNARHHEWVFVVSKAELQSCEHIKVLKFPEIKTRLCFQSYRSQSIADARFKKAKNERTFLS